MKKNWTLLLLLSFFSINVQSQKLSNIQHRSLRVPSNVIIDGKAKEWNNKFEAFNSATEVFYSISNDDENIYFVIRAVTGDIVKRVTDGGITLTFKKPGTNKGAGGVAITYPALQQYVNFKITTGRRDLTDTTGKAADSIKQYNNDLVNKNYKWIKVLGIQNLDTLISVYNTDGIKAYGLFDEKKNYTCEFSISLKNLGLSADRSDLVRYTLQVNGTTPAGHASIYGKVNDVQKEAILQTFLDKGNAHYDQLSTPAYFSGEYILAKKP